MKKKNIAQILAGWLDVILLVAGMVLISIGFYQIYIPIGYIVTGGCFIALAFFVGKQQVVKSNALR